ncbi:MAG: hypothetical protein IPQ07_21990 [Myxococcales bacterium]|nr:hypothetical protein [Myxococcales bacterium]
MRTKLIVVVAGVALGAGGVAAWRLAREGDDGDRGHRRDHDEDEREAGHGPQREDSRSKLPGIHRAGPKELAVRNRVGRTEAAKLAGKAGQLARLPSVPATTWVSIGPDDAPKEFNFFEIAGVDSGRPNSIVVDPRDPNVVYVAVSGGGVWKSYDFLSAHQAWHPTMDTQPNLAVGALAIDADHPDTLYAGTGDFVDASGNTVQKTIDGGGTWGTPVELAGTYPGANGVAANVGSIRSLAVRGDLVFAATDAGLFQSTDAGASFQLVDLPNPDGKLLAESLFSIVEIGGGGWVASGMAACDEDRGAPGLFGFDPNPGFCPLGNNAAFWRTADGVTWTSITATPAVAGTGRTMLAAGPTSDPAHTAVYAYIGSGFGNRTIGFWRSLDGGASWSNATGLLANPTLLDPNGDDTCLDTDIGHDQSWYNQAIVVDPTNGDHVLVGGNLCGMRTLNGTAELPTWELVSHWLPGTAYGETANGRLSYVHADWHTATSVSIDGVLRTFAGTDGGVFSTTTVFDPATPAEQVTWTHHNRGLTTHLMYSVASGDPVTGDPFLAFSGLQDNGTRFRADPHHPAAFNQAIGGDGIGATVHAATSGTTYWASVQFERCFCKPAENDCSVEVPEAEDPDSHWHFTASPTGPALEDRALEERMRERARITGEDQEPFLMHYANVETDTVGQSVLSHSDGRVFVSEPQGTGFVWRPISQDLSTDMSGNGFANVSASRGQPGVFAAVGMTSLSPFWYTTAGTVQQPWIATGPVSVNLSQRMSGPSSIDFPFEPPAGTQPGQVFIGAFTGVMTPAGEPPPDAKGRLYRTTNFGATWQSIVGADPAHQLPNVPIYVVKYDPVTPTTIYAGTDLGVYLTTDDGVTWNRMGEGLPMVPVRDIYIAKNQEFIRVATYGRGLWEIYPSAGANRGVAGDGDYDRNLKIDWIDVAALSSRLGVTPANTTPPFYSWILDLSAAGSDPPLAAIDRSDLSALVRKFGGHP